MSTSERVTVKDVARVAELANLQLLPEEELAMQRDLNAILDHVAQLNELDTSAVLPMAQVSEIVSEKLDGGAQSHLRTDEVRPSLDRAAVMACAPLTDGVFFKVPKVIER
jgi:aspartyl-tRNA(Asn)/glutamyl-tRNA(Gln) amidotransferase subunit C